MMQLDHERLAALEDEFKEQEDGITLPKFIWLMQCAISHPPNEKYDLVRGLIGLFNDIDINGDRHIEWSEFTQYIIDAVVTQTELPLVQNSKVGSTSDATQNAQNANRILESTKVNINYVPNKNLIDNTSYKGPMTKIHFLKDTQEYLILEMQQKR